MIRPATMLDLPWLRQLHTAFCAEFASEYPITDQEELDAFTLGLAKSLGEDPGFCLIVAEDEHRLVGYLGCGIMVRYIGKPKQVVTPHWFYIDPSYRGQGLARAMVAHALAWLREKWPQVTTIEVPSRHGNHRWEDLGFKPFLTYSYGNLSLADAFVTGPARRPNGLDHDTVATEEEDHG